MAFWLAGRPAVPQLRVAFLVSLLALRTLRLFLRYVLACIYLFSISADCFDYFSYSCVYAF